MGGGKEGCNIILEGKLDHTVWDRIARPRVAAKGPIIACRAFQEATILKEIKRGNIRKIERARGKKSCKTPKGSHLDTTPHCEVFGFASFDARAASTSTRSPAAAPATASLGSSGSSPRSPAPPSASGAPTPASSSSDPARRCPRQPHYWARLRPLVRCACLLDLLRISDDILRVRHLVVEQIFLVMHDEVVTNGCGAMPLGVVGKPRKDISSPVHSRNTA